MPVSDLDDLFSGDDEDCDEETAAQVDAALRAVDEAEPQLVAHVIEGAPVPDDARIPAGWEMRAHTAKGQACLLRRIVKRHGKGQRTELIGVAYDHVVVSSIMVDVDTGETHLELAFSAGRRWVRQTIHRTALASGRAAAEALAGFGFPIHAGNAKDLVQWIVDFEASNIALLPRCQITRQMGWQPTGGFIIGVEHLRSNGEPEITYQGADTGDQHLARCLGTAGELEGWRQGVAVLERYPSVELAIYAALAPPMLKILRAPNFCVEWSYKTSSGKTTALSVGASVWGNPDPNDRDSLIASWDMTPVGFERRAAVLTGLPLLVDDTKRARRYRGESVVPGVIYEVSNGQGRVRGSTEGTAATRYWRTVMLTTGEQRCVDFDKSGGTAARVVSLWGNPFGASTEAIAGDISRLSQAIYANFGWAGRVWVQWVRENEPEWPGWFATLGEIRHGFRQAINATDNRPGDASVVDRLAGNLAVLELTARMAHVALELPWERTGAVLELVGQASAGAKVVDREAEALGLLASHLSANLQGIEGTVADKAPPGGWIGWIDSTSPSKPWSVLGVHVAACKKMLEGWGFEPNSILRRWREEGVTNCERGRTDRKLTIEGGRRVRMVAFYRAPLEAAGFGADSTEEPNRQEEIPF